jgi:hypothetical protein
MQRGSSSSGGRTRRCTPVRCGRERRKSLPSIKIWYPEAGSSLKWKIVLSESRREREVECYPASFPLPCRRSRSCSSVAHIGVREDEGKQGGAEANSVPWEDDLLPGSLAACRNPSRGAKRVALRSPETSTEGSAASTHGLHAADRGAICSEVKLRTLTLSWAHLLCPIFGSFW